MSKVTPEEVSRALARLAALQKANALPETLADLIEAVQDPVTVQALWLGGNHNHKWRRFRRL